MLQDKLVSCMKLNHGQNFYFQDDNCSVHKAKIVKDFKTEHNVNVLEWPAKSPDLNIVEDIWKMLSDIVYDRKYEGIGECYIGCPCIRTNEQDRCHFGFIQRY